MNRTKQLPAGHLLVPALAIGLLSLALAAGLSALGILDRLDALAARLVPPVDAAAYPKALPAWAVWLVAVVFAGALPLAILGVAGAWRRALLWITSLVLIAGWAPVLGLAARAPDVSAPFVVALWAGVCALVYASSHRMDSDGKSGTQANPRTGISHEAR